MSKCKHEVMEHMHMHSNGVDYAKCTSCGVIRVMNGFVDDWNELQTKLKASEAECERLRKSNRILADMHVTTVFDYELKEQD